MQMRPGQDEIDFEHRILCPDGACIGVIGPDGRCKVCGAFAGNDVLQQLEAGGAGTIADQADAGTADADDYDDGAADEIAAEAGGDAPVEAEAEAPSGFEDRELCP